MRAATVVIPTVFPSSTSTSESVPAAGAGISVSTLSVEISNNGASRSTRSPGFLSHLVSVPSTMLSPIWGITTSVMSVLSFVGRERRIEQQVAFKNPAEMGRELLPNLFERGAHAELRHRGHGLGQAAGNDVLEVTEVG